MAPRDLLHASFDTLTCVFHRRAVPRAINFVAPPPNPGAGFFSCAADHRLSFLRQTGHFFIRKGVQARQQWHIIRQPEPIRNSYKLIYIAITRHALLVRSPLAGRCCFRRDKVILRFEPVRPPSGNCHSTHRILAFSYSSAQQTATIHIAFAVG
jgi:hypothetical protein